jgi:hypothetical protein
LEKGGENRRGAGALGLLDALFRAQRVTYIKEALPRELKSLKSLKNRRTVER